MQPAPAQAPAPSHYINRELSQLDFDERVLAMAQDESLPLLEQARLNANPLSTQTCLVREFCMNRSR